MEMKAAQGGCYCDSSVCAVLTMSAEPLLAFSCKLWGMGMTVKGLQSASVPL